MKKFLCIPLLFVLFGCSSIQTTFDYDKTADFSSYKTFAYTKESLELPVNQLNLQRIVDAVNNEMILKGFTENKDSDIAIDLHLKTEKKVEANATTTGTGYGRYGWGAGVSTTQVSYDEYTDGTLFISFIDSKTGKLVWQGTGSKTLDEQASVEEREKSINYSVQQIMSNYPPQTTNK